MPATKVQPKEMLPIVDKPVIQFVVEEAISSGIDDIVTGRRKRTIEVYFDFALERDDLGGEICKYLADTVRAREKQQTD